MGAWAVLFGALAMLELSEQAAQAVQIASTATFAGLVFAWYRFDAEDRGYQRSALLNVGIIVFSLIFLPYYLFRSRGAKAGSLAVLGALGILAGVFALVFVGAFLSYYVGPA